MSSGITNIFQLPVLPVTKGNVFLMNLQSLHLSQLQALVHSEALSPGPGSQVVSLPMQMGVPEIYKTEIYRICI